MFQDDGKELRLHLKDPELCQAPQRDIEETDAAPRSADARSRRSDSNLQRVRGRPVLLCAWRNTTQAAVGMGKNVNSQRQGPVGRKHSTAGDSEGAPFPKERASPKATARWKGTNSGGVGILSDAADGANDQCVGDQNVG